MSPSSISIFDLAAESLACIFAFLPPDECVRLERVSWQWRELVRKYGWIGFRTLKLDKQELEQEGDLAESTECCSRFTLTSLAKHRALLDRCAPHLRELSTAIVDCNVEQWVRMRNLRHLRFDMCVSSCTLRAITDNLKHLQSIQFSDINWRSVAVLHDLLRINNASLQALHLPLSNSRGYSLCLPALPSSLRLLHLGVRSPYNNFYPGYDQKNCDRVDELLELAATCCPQLGILMLPTVNELSLAKLAQYEKLFYLRLCFALSDANLLAFGHSLATIGAQLRALLLGVTNSRMLQLIAEHCPLLEHCSFHINCHYAHLPETEGPLLLSALQSLFQLTHLRSVSISYSCAGGLCAQILDAINGLNAKGALEYLALSGLLLPADFITNLIQCNPKLRKLTCSIRNDNTYQLDKLNMLLQNMDGPLELELFEQILPQLKMRENSRVRIVRRFPAEPTSHPIFRQFLARTMTDSMP